MATSRTSWWTIAFLLVMAAMAVEIALLINENRNLRAQLDGLTDMFQPLAADQRLPTISGEDIYGKPLSIRYGPDSPTTVLLWFSPSCDACEGNLAFWNDLYDQYASEQLRFVGMCAGMIDEAQTFAEAHAMSFPILSVTDNRLIDAYRGHVLPQTVLLSSDGTVIRVWPGMLEEDMISEVYDAVGSLSATPTAASP
ncbi:TlpA family protein disulfide reductase [bacterium]|nr:TlpA family protein disulfide reductase [bacterium]